MLKMIHVSAAHMSVTTTQTRVARLWALNLSVFGRQILAKLLIHALPFEAFFRGILHGVIGYTYNCLAWVLLRVASYRGPSLV